MTLHLVVAACWLSSCGQATSQGLFARCIFVSLLWWQPFALWPRAGLVVQFVCKIAGLFAVGWMIADRAQKPAAE